VQSTIYYTKIWLNESILEGKRHNKLCSKKRDIIKIIKKRHHTK
jgi:hypothetical protein